MKFIYIGLTWSSKICYFNSKKLSTNLMKLWNFLSLIRINLMLSRLICTIL